MSENKPQLFSDTLSSVNYGIQSIGEWRYKHELTLNYTKTQPLLIEHIRLNAQMDQITGPRISINNSPL